MIFKSSVNNVNCLQGILDEDNDDLLYIPGVMTPTEVSIQSIFFGFLLIKTKAFVELYIIICKIILQILSSYNAGAKMVKVRCFYIHVSLYYIFMLSAHLKLVKKIKANFIMIVYL